MGEVGSRWNIFSLLSSGFVENMKSAIVFGNSGNEVLIITKDDQFLGFGTNANGCLGENFIDIYNGF